MTSLLLSVILAIPAVGQAQQQPGKTNDGKMDMQKIDGTWTVVYAEIEGKNVDNKSLATVTIKNNVLTCQHDGKQKSFKLEFGPHHMIRCTHKDGDSASANTSSGKESHTHHGVYIAGKEYFCISLDKGMDRRFTTSTTDREQRDRDAQQPRTQDRWGGRGPYGSAMVFILRRSGSESK